MFFIFYFIFHILYLFCCFVIPLKENMTRRHQCGLSLCWQNGFTLSLSLSLALSFFLSYFLPLFSFLYFFLSTFLLLITYFSELSLVYSLHITCWVSGVSWVRVFWFAYRFSLIIIFFQMLVLLRRTSFWPPYIDGCRFVDRINCSLVTLVTSYPSK